MGIESVVIHPSQEKAKDGAPGLVNLSGVPVVLLIAVIVGVAVFCFFQGYIAVGIVCLLGFSKKIWVASSIGNFDLSFLDSTLACSSPAAATHSMEYLGLAVCWNAAFH